VTTTRDYSEELESEILSTKDRREADIEIVLDYNILIVSLRYEKDFIRIFGF
jgi:hypothetical protein